MNPASSGGRPGELRRQLAAEQNAVQVGGRPEPIGRRRSCAGLDAGWTMYGVTMITSSLSPRWKSFDLNSAPMTGNSPMPGRAFVAIDAGLLQQSGDGEALAAAQLDRRLGAPHGQRRDGQRAAGRPAR